MHPYSNQRNNGSKSSITPWLILTTILLYILYSSNLLLFNNNDQQDCPPITTTTATTTRLDDTATQQILQISTDNNTSMTTSTEEEVASIDNENKETTQQKTSNDDKTEDEEDEKETIISSEEEVENNYPVVVRLTPKQTAQTTETELKHIVFGIAASSNLWEQRKEYIKVWWRPKETRGVVWLDQKVTTTKNEGLPEIRISSDTSNFKYTNNQGQRSALRISRVVTETLKLGMKDVRCTSESHIQNMHFSYAMAYGGGGFAISYPLAVELAKIQDRCIQRYPALYGSDDRIHACMAELGVPLTKEFGFHQYDVYGNLLGLLGAHPVAPLISIHHLDVIIRGMLPPRELEMPSRTFLNWYKRADYTAYAFNTRPVFKHPCQSHFYWCYNLDTAAKPPYCRWRMPSPEIITSIVVTKSPDPLRWKKSPRRDCCKVLPSRKPSTLYIWVANCREGEVIEMQ
ncbi:Transferring glycosyl group transferase [Arachis hypogaea]|nr:Transferring glycosyl group transferase [Arachis hypogaea]